MLVDIASQWTFTLICRSTKQRNQQKLLFNEYIWNHTILTLIGYCIYIYIIWRPGPGINSSLSQTEKNIFPCSFQIKREFIWKFVHHLAVYWNHIMFKFLELERFPNKADIFFNEIKTHIQRYKVNLMIQHIQHWKRRLPTNIKNLKPSTLWLMLAIGKEKCQRNKCCGIWRTVSQSGHVSMWLNPMIFYHRDTKSLEQNFFSTS